MKAYKRITIHFILIFIALLISSCTKKGFIVDVNEGPPTDQCIVFGKLTLMDSEGVKKWGEVFYDQPLLVLLPPGSDIADSYRIKDDGNFFWALSPGNYTILGFGDRMFGDRKLPMKAKFTVPVSKKSMYIGDFLLLVLQENIFSNKIVDNSQIAISNFKDQFPDIQETPIVDIMVTENKIGSYENIQHICKSKWGIKCEIKYFFGKSFHGVIPTTPEASIHSFQKINSLSPSFKWQPSSQKNVSYDLIIYEAAIFYFDGFQKVYLPGKIFLLEENIKEPNYELEKELKPGTNYYWSVRLREDNEVSTWSLFHYIYNYVIGVSSGFNQLFSFSTPSIN